MPNEPIPDPSKKPKPDDKVPGQQNPQLLPNMLPSSLTTGLGNEVKLLPYITQQPQPQMLQPPSQTSLENSAQVQQALPAKPPRIGRKPRRGHIDARPKDAQGNLIPAWGKKGLISESRMGKWGSGLAGFYAMNPNARRGLDLRLGQRAEADSNTTSKTAPSARPRPAPLAPGTPQQQMDAKNGIVARTEDRTVFDNGAEVTKKVDENQTYRTLSSPYGSGSSTVTQNTPKPAQLVNSQPAPASKPESSQQPPAITPPQKSGAIYTKSFATNQPGAASTVNDQLKRKQQMT